ncbi:MAG: YgjV family protein [Shewanella sp.]|nr:YgjV family protein [Shewanella sp.]MCF1432063.1 YgjV family protein [Shewanella sp.]MCF1439767.1 YgjV family protein [Shewanella sp.]MCF1456920.1 YgjV family protein [Shewanella sp.]
MLGFFIGASAFIHQDGTRFRLHLMGLQIVLCSHFILMDTWITALACGISALRSFASTRTLSTLVMLFFIALLWVLGLPPLEQHYELLTLFGASVAPWALFKTQGIITIPFS